MEDEATLTRNPLSSFTLEPNACYLQ